jgi:penicillin V acylase-like amidase (Ntn superfamily)
MNTYWFTKVSQCLIAAISLASVISPQTEACTRALFVGSEDVVITGRSMDWAEDMHSNLWVFPRGIKRDGSAGKQSITWTSLYGSLIVSAYDVGTADGINEEGLVTNILYLAESDYGKPSDKDQLLAISLWAQYVLDRFATVNEAVESFQQQPFAVIPSALPGLPPSQLHLSISDATGDSAIFEYIDGKIVTHHGKEYTIMTNSPTFDQQLALNTYWEEIGGLVFLPGTNRAADRFARASFLLKSLPRQIVPQYITAVPKGTFVNQALSSMMGVIRSVGVPLGITTPGHPNISSSIWRTVADQKNKVLFFDSATSPNTFWVPLADLDFSEGAPVKKLTVDGGKVYCGNAATHFEISPPFTFLPANPST